MTASGYSYFGTLFLFAFCSSLSLSFIASDNSGLLSRTVPSSSRLVMNDVFTFAPFSYVMDVWQMMWFVFMMCLREDSDVSVGAKRKNPMPRRM